MLLYYLFFRAYFFYHLFFIICWCANLKTFFNRLIHLQTSIGWISPTLPPPPGYTAKCLSVWGGWWSARAVSSLATEGWAAPVCLCALLLPVWLVWGGWRAERAGRHWEPAGCASVVEVLSRAQCALHLLVLLFWGYHHWYFQPFLCCMLFFFGNIFIVTIFYAYSQLCFIFKNTHSWYDTFTRYLWNIFLALFKCNYIFRMQ